jgi:hypothetical protein
LIQAGENGKTADELDRADNYRMNTFLHVFAKNGFHKGIALAQKKFEDKNDEFLVSLKAIMMIFW